MGAPVAGPGFNRWMIPPAALAIHLCIGQAYAFSVFNLPLGRQLGVQAPMPDDWTLAQLGWVFTLAIVCLGLSAAFGGRWLERVGPRRSGLVAAACWSSGFGLGALGVHLHVLPLVLFGYGVVGGTGLGLGYITPVSTLIKWFPDRRGMATGMAIMGFGGGAMIASPLSEILMRQYAGPHSTGVVPTFSTLGVLYGLAMIAGALAFRVPPAGWTPPGWTPPPENEPKALVTRHHVHATEALRTPQFYLLWAVLFLNVSAGIGVLGQAAPMIAEIFRGRVDAGAAAGFVGLLSLFNMLGRFFWSSMSDRFGRKRTYLVFFVAGPALYALVPVMGRAGNMTGFVACVCVIMSMYGGGFATIPAYLADVFGTQYVGAIHGRLLTAWSAAGVAGPVLINYLREYRIAQGVARASAYDGTMLILAGALCGGLLANLAVRPVHPRHHMTEEALAADRATRAAGAAAANGGRGPSGAPAAPHGAPVGLRVALAWLAAGLPLLWGVAMTVKKAAKLFG